MKSVLFFTAFLSFGWFICSAQETRDIQQIWKDNIRKHLSSMLEEKHYSHKGTSRTGTGAVDKATQQVGSEVLVSDYEGQESEIHAAINPLDSANIVISPIRETLEGALQLPIFVTHDFGVTWTQSSFTHEGTGGGDPVFAFAADGTLYFSWLDLAFDEEMTIYMYFVTSTDGGTTWSEKDTIDYGKMTFIGGGKMVDKQWMAVDQSNSPRRNTLYTAYVLMQDDPDSFYGIVMKRKLPGKAEFDEETIELTDDSFDRVQFPSVNVDADGRVHVCWWGVRNNINGLWHRMSEDGVTFGPVHKVASVRFPSENSSVPDNMPQRFGVMCQFDVDRFPNSPNKNTLYAVWNSNSLTQRGTASYNKPIWAYFCASYDGGETWSNPIRLSDAPDTLTMQFHPSIAVSPSGSIAATWYDGREDRLNSEIHYYTAFSHDGGRTFTRNLQVSGVGSDVGEQGAFGVGDYDRALATSWYAIPVWADGRSNDGDMNVYAAFINFHDQVSVERVLPVSRAVRLLDPVPNPVQNEASISFVIEKGSSITLNLFDASGRLVRTLAEGQFESGLHTLPFAAQSLPNGLYFIRLDARGVYALRRLSVMH